MPTLGEELKLKRTEKGISLQTISESTKIGTHFLKCIDEGNYSALPGGIFTRSFIRAYARQVGMNEDEAITLYHQEVTDDTAPLPRVEPASPEVEVKPATTVVLSGSMNRGGSSDWLRIVIAVLLVGGIVVGVFFLVRRVNSPDDAGQRAQNGKSAQPSESPAKPGTSPAAANPSNPGNRDRQGIPPAQPSPAQGTNPGSDQAITVRVEAANGPSWLRYQVDGEKSVNVMLQQGQTQDIPRAQNQIKLNLGNRTAVKLKINNHDATFPQGTPNFAAQVVISRDNLRTYIQ